MEPGYLSSYDTDRDLLSGGGNGNAAGGYYPPSPHNFEGQGSSDSIASM